ncbi:MAG TPA: hypothetical protein VKS43_11330 [Burkholderiales bacterium]|nr:hypothetical protein [Burkholderiales bacterium]
MHMAIQGGLVGLGIAAFLYAFEYLAVKRAAAERSKKMAKKMEINQEEISRLRAVRGLCYFLPIGCAIGAWLVWG